MNNSYLSSIKNALLLSKPFRLFLMVLFVCLFANTTVTAQISTLNAWSNVYHNTATTAQTVTYAIPAGSGANRILVVAIASSQTAVGARTVTLTYGGQSLTSINGDMATNTVRQHTQLYYLNEGGLDAATGTNLVFTVGGGSTRITDVFAAVYDGVDQTTPITDSKTYSSGIATLSNPVFGSALTVNAYDQAVKIISSMRTASTTARTITNYATNWGLATTERTSTATDAIRNAVANRSISTTNSTDVSSTTFSGTSLASMTGMSLKCAPTTPTITSLGLTSGCVGSSITINGTNLGTVTAANLKIGGTAVTSITSNSGTQIVAVIGAGTTGVVTATNYWGTTTTSADTFTVNAVPARPTLAAAGTINFCAGGSVVLTSSSSDNEYLWYKDGVLISGATSQSYSVTTSGSYTVKVINANGCQSILSTAIVVTVSPAPTIEFTQNQNDKTYTISAANCGDIAGGNQNDIDIGSGDPGGSATYQWQVSYDGMASWSNGPGPTATTIQYVLDPVYTFYEKVAGVYYFRVIITNNGCDAISDTIVLTVTAGSSNLSSGTIAGNQNYCSTQNPTTFTQTNATGGDGNGYIYQWQSSTDNINFNNIGGATRSTYDSGSISQTTYYRRIVSSGSCTAISNTIAVSIQRPAVTVIQTSCSYAGTITVISPPPVGSTITYTLARTTPSVVSISNTNGVFTGLVPGNYTVTHNIAGCQSFGTLVTINGTPSPASVPNASATFQPSTFVPTGVITVSPINIGYTYSIDGTNYTNTTGIFYSVAPGTYNVTAMNGAGCPSSAATVVTINSLTPKPTITADGPTTFCSGGSLTLTSSAGTSYLWSTGETTVSISPTISGSYTVQVTTNGYQSSSNETVVTVNPSPEKPTVTFTQPDCKTATGSVVLTGLPASGTWNLYQNGNATPIIIGGSGTSTTISDLAVGTYTYTVSSGTCVSNASSSVVIAPLVTNTWDGSKWSTLADPTIDQNIIFNGNYTSSSDLSGCTCQVNSGVNVIISPSNTLTIYNQVAVLGLGTLTFDSSSSDVNSKPISNSGSLVQNNNTPLVANSGDIIYKRTVPAIHNTDFTYWSSPVSSETFSGFSPQSQNKYYFFDADSDSWALKNSSATMDKGNGYCIYGPQNINNSSFTGSFKGTPNNGSVEITPVKINQNYLIGNPYPSAIDADLFILANAGVIDGALYFWTHNTDPVNGQYIYEDYATYNLTGGTGTKASKGIASTSVNANAFFNANIPNGYIAAGQGFFVGSNATTITDTKIVFDNSMRVGNGTLGLNSNFFKTKGNTKTKATKAIEKDRVWLNLSNDQGVFKQTLVGYITGATNDYDTTFDADSYDSLDGADFYSVNGDSNLVIQGRAFPFDENDTVPLGFRSSSDGNYTINIDQVDGSLTNQAVFIEDKLTNTVTDLKNGNYTFNTVAGAFNDRFVLKYTNKTLAVDAMDKEDGILVLYSKNYKTLIIHNNMMDSTVNTVTLYNTTGQKISYWDVEDSGQTNIQIPIKNNERRKQQKNYR
jgi:hypothetical protein